MNMDRLKDSVKQHEGYRNKVYLDTLGKRTVGVGHLCVEDFWEDDKEYDEKFLLEILEKDLGCLLYTSPSPRDKRQSRMPSSA